MSSDSNRRAIEALKLRKSGMTFKAVGQALAVGPSQASSLFAKGERIFRAAMANPHMPVADLSDFTIEDYETATRKRHVERLEARVRRLERLLERHGIDVPFDERI